MQIIVEVPGKLPDAVHCTPQQFEQEASNPSPVTH
jgi:hypothetical protein